MSKTTLLIMFSISIIFLLAVGFGFKGIVIGGAIGIMILALDVIVNWVN